MAGKQTAVLGNSSDPEDAAAGTGTGALTQIGGVSALRSDKRTLHGA